MKKFLAVAVGAIMAASMLAPAGAKPKPKSQTQEGAITLPGVFAQGQFSGCWAGATRRITQTAAGQGNGVAGYRFAVDEATWGGKFKLEPTGGEGTVDLDIFMYTVMPPAEAVADDPVNGGTPVSVDYTTREEGGETGLIPEGTTDAIVCMYGGPEYVGFNSTFEYVGTAPTKKKK
jgi:opacity protein-like surface antigen